MEYVQYVISRGVQITYLNICIDCILKAYRKAHPEKLLPDDFGEVCQTLENQRKCIAHYEERIRKLEQEIQELGARPGGPDYEDARARFELGIVLQNEK
jgi:hypothetical protein